MTNRSSLRTTSEFIKFTHRVIGETLLGRIWLALKQPPWKVFIRNEWRLPMDIKMGSSALVLRSWYMLDLRQVPSSRLFWQNCIQLAGRGGWVLRRGPSDPLHTVLLRDVSSPQPNYADILQSGPVELLKMVTVWLMGWICAEPSQWKPYISVSLRIFCSPNVPLCHVRIATNNPICSPRMPLFCARVLFVAIFIKESPSANESTALERAWEGGER